jgi:GntR family transcriptional regulator
VQAKTPTTDDLQGRLRRIWRDAAESGSTFPSELALSASLGVSRPALREALVRLERDGLIRRRKGADTIVNPAALDLGTRFDERIDFADTIARAGMVPEVEILEVGLVALPAPEAVLFEVPEGSPCYRTIKRWRGDGEVLMVATDLVPLHGVDGAPPPQPETTVFELVASLFGEVVEWEVGVPGAAVLDRRMATWLERPVGDAALTLELVGVTSRGRLAYRALEHHLPGRIRSGFVRSLRPL